MQPKFLQAGAGLVVDGLSVARGGRQVLSDVSFAVPPGRALVVTGPNGTGKSTLLRALAGLTAVAAGEAAWAGEMLAASDTHFVGHLNALKPTETVAGNLKFWASWYGARPSDTLVDDALDGVGLLALAELPAAVLSQGQQRRLALARLALAERPIWLLDEPTAGLDAASRDRLAAAMASHLSSGGVLIAATHEPLGLNDPLSLDLGQGTH